MNYKKSLSLKSSSREGIRKEVVNLFLDENPGTGKGDECSKYDYLVESYKNYQIHLHRPANLNKGFDFTVHVTGCGKIFGKRKNMDIPSHDNVIEALSYYKMNYPKNYPIISRLINDIYHCKAISLNVDLPLGNSKLKDSNFFSIEIILLTIKWLFIEQDITYWNWSGRKMLYDALLSKELI